MTTVPSHTRTRQAIVTDGGRGSSRSALATVRALGAAGHRVIVTVADEELAAVSRHTAETVRVPPTSQPEAYAAALEDLRSRNPDVVFATSDVALRILGLSCADLVDKEVLAIRAPAAGIRVPESAVFDSVDGLFDAELPFPAVVKPAVGSDSAVLVADRAGLSRLSPSMGRVVVQPHLDGPLSAMSGVMWGGELRAVLHQRATRTWPVDCGTASAAITVEPDHAREVAVGELLGEHHGIFQVQFLGSTLIDVNPRPYGSMGLALAAGLNLPDLVCDLSLGASAPRLQRADVGRRYRWIEGDLRHVAHELRRGSMGVGRVAAAVRPRRGTAHSVIDVRDPGPALLRARQVIRRARAGRR